MKKQLLSVLIAAALGTGAHAQVADSVTLGAGYANQVWYSLQNDEQGTAPKNNWDIGFDVVEITSSLHINSVAGAMLWNYPKGNKNAWATVDTTGLSSWDPRYNADDDWARGAMGRYGDAGNPSDLDWGIYDMSTHIVTGDSIYIIKLVSGAFKKLYIEKLTSGTFYFKFADLDGQNEVSEQVNKSQFTDKNLGYYSITNRAIVNREPIRDKWDLVFTQYTGFVQGMAYNVTGVLHNRKVTAAKAAGLADKTNYKSWQAHSFVPEINTIGYDWKTLVGGSYVIKDSTAYFVQSVSGDIWKIIFTGFSMTDGKIAFSKQKLMSVSIAQANHEVTTVALYPNPSNGSNVQVVYSIAPGNKVAMLNITDMAGRSVYVQPLDNSAGLHTHFIPASVLSSSMYVVTVTTDGGRAQRKLVVQ